MPYNESDHRNTGRYFKVASGYVPNQFSVKILKEGVIDQEAGFINGGNPLYLLNLEPWVIEELTLPQIQYNVRNDIYMDADSLIQPDYIASVNTTGEISLKIREKSDLAIHRSLIRCQKEFYNDRYEGTGSLGIEYSVIVTIKSQRLDDSASNNDGIFGDNQIIFGRAILTEIGNPTFSHSDNKFLKYDVKIQVNCMAETYSLLGRYNMKRFKQAIGSKLGSASSSSQSTKDPFKTNNAFAKDGMLGADKVVKGQEAEKAKRDAEAFANRGDPYRIGGVDYSKHNAAVTDRVINNLVPTPYPSTVATSGDGTQTTLNFDRTKPLIGNMVRPPRK